MALLATAVDVEESLVVDVQWVVFVLCALISQRWICIYLAEVRHSGVATIASEVKLVVKLIDVMAIVTVDGAGQTDPMGLYNLRKLDIPPGRVLNHGNRFKSHRVQKVSLLFVARLAREDRLVDVTVSPTAPFLNEL
jgi:hypothetical protein